MVLLHAVGVTGILAGYGQYFLDFTAVNLLVNGVLAFWADWEERHWTWIVAFAGGIAVEIVGVCRAEALASRKPLLHRCTDSWRW